jgi:hypothetical protein
MKAFVMVIKRKDRRQMCCIFCILCEGDRPTVPPVLHKKIGHLFSPFKKNTHLYKVVVVCIQEARDVSLLHVLAVEL